MSNLPQFASTFNTGAAKFENGDGTTKATLITPGSNGTRVMQIVAATDDTSDVTLDVFLTISAVDYQIGSVTIPAGTGTSGDGGVSILDNLSAAKNILGTGAPVNVLDLASGDVLKVAPNSAVTAAKTLWIYATGKDF